MQGRWSVHGTPSCGEGDCATAPSRPRGEEDCDPDPPPGADNVVLAWNRTALDTIREISITQPPTDPGYASRALAMQSIAMFDVLQAIDDHPGFLVSLDAPIDISDQAAVSAAAHEILVELFPDFRQDLDRAFARRLAEIEDGVAEDQGVAFGEQVAQAVIAARADDGADPYGTLGRVAGFDPGEYRPTPPDFTDAIQPNWGDVDPFVLASGDQFRAPPPPSVTSAAYTADFEEVRRLGERNSSERTEAQTVSAIWWSNDADSYTRVGHWNDIAVRLLTEQGRDLGESAYLLAALNVGLADALIACWDTKYTYDAWRPITAIREADTDGNPATTADPDWLPLLPETPDHPEYPSGHGTLGATASEVMTDFFGPIPFASPSDALPGVILEFDNFDQAAEEEAASRIYAGVHFGYSADAALLMGRQVGEVTVDAFDQFARQGAAAPLA
jgi:hypothetical protein